MSSLYQPAEIVKKLGGITVRQIIDITHKEVVVPIRLSSGQGIPNLYNKTNIFQLLVAVQIRGVFPVEVAKKIIVDVTKTKQRWLHFRRKPQITNTKFWFSDEAGIDFENPLTQSSFVDLHTIKHIVESRF